MSRAKFAVAAVCCLVLIVAADSSLAELAAPTPLTPASGSTTPAAAPIQFSWTPVTGAAGYRIWVVEYPNPLSSDHSGPCPNCVAKASTPVPNYTEVGGLPASRVYWWQVQALPTGEWSVPAMFARSGLLRFRSTLLRLDRRSIPGTSWFAES